MRRFSYGLMILVAGTALTGCVIKPDPIKTDAHIERARLDVSALYKAIEPIEKPLTLSESVARGILYNYDYKMGLMEEVLQGKQLTLANFNLLPRVAANAGYGWRSTERATRSINYETRAQSLPHSFSEERRTTTADIGFSWNILDFGLGYYQAKQQSDRVLAAVEKRRRVMNNLVKEIQIAYWKALTAQRLLPEVNVLLRDVKKAIKNSKEIEEKKLQPPAATLEYRRTLLQVLTQLKQLRADLSIAKAQLGSLINIKPGDQFSLASPDAKLYRLPRIGKDMEALHEYSLVFRPELREEAYQERIDRQNIKKEIIRVFPGVSLLGSKNVDSNKLLKFQNWTELGLRASWNLIGVLQAPTAIKNAEVQVDIDKMRRLALTAAVLSQVTISYGEYQQAVGVYVTAKELSDIEKKMLKISSDRERANSGTEMDLIQKRAQAIAADLSKDNALANAKAALSNLVTSVGLDIVPASTGTDNLKETTLLVDKAIRQIQSGDLDKMIALPKPSEKPDSPKMADVKKQNIEPASGPIGSVRNPVKAFFSQFKSKSEPIELEKMTPVTPEVSASNVKSVAPVKVTVKSANTIRSIEPASGHSENPVRSFINGFKSGSNEFKMDKGVKPARAGNS